MLTRNDVETALDYMDKAQLIRLGRVTGKWYQLYCPFHNDGQEKKPSCGCSLEGEVRNGTEYLPGTWHCFSCGASYSFGHGIREILRLKSTSLAAHPELAKYVEATADTSNLSEEANALVSKISTATQLENIYSWMASLKKKYVSEEELASYRFTVPYMYQRKLTDEVIERYDVGFDGKYVPPGRKKPLPCVTFPVRDETGGTLFFCRRSIEGKFFNYPEGVEKPVYGIYELPKDCREVIICESVFNALTCVVYGHPAVALLGTGNTKQIEQLKRLGVNTYVIALDNDDAGRKGTAKLKEALRRNGFVLTMTVPDDGRDINDLTYEEFMQCYNNRS